MFKNYLKTGIRSLMKNKTFSFINLFGLAIGTLCCIYILLYINDQYSYDTHHKEVTGIYRITTSLATKGERHTMSTASPPIAPAMKNDFAEVKQFTRLVTSIGANQLLLRYKEKSFYERDAVFVDSTFFNVFTYHFLNGNSSKVLDEPYSVVLLKPVADKLFGKADPVGKIIEIDNTFGKNNFKVTGVADESFGKSHIKANLFITMNSGGMGEFVRQSDAWAGNNFTNAYVKLQPNTNVAALEAKLPQFLQDHGAQQLTALGIKKILHLQPVSTIHTTAGYEVELTKTVSPSFLYILLLIAVLIQMIACINFMNLSTARALKKSKGSRRKKSDWRRAERPYPTIYERVFLAFACRCISCLAFAGPGITLSQSPYRRRPVSFIFCQL